MFGAPQYQTIDETNAKLAKGKAPGRVFEIRFGLNSMPAGKRQAQRVAAFERILTDVIEQRLAPFDSIAAEQTADLAADRSRRGRPGELRDTMIAGIAMAAEARLATRNVRHFADLPVAVVNPWTD